MPIVKGEILAEDKNTVIYPKTSIDQVEGAYLGDAKALLKEFHNLRTASTMSISNVCKIVIYANPESSFRIITDDSSINLEFTSPVQITILRNGNNICISYIMTGGVTTIWRTGNPSSITITNIMPIIEYIDFTVEK